MHKRRRWVILIVVSTLVIVGARFVYQVAYRVRGIPDAYAMSDMGLLLIDYMQTHEKRWPGGWDAACSNWEEITQ